MRMNHLRTTCLSAAALACCVSLAAAQSPPVTPRQPPAMDALAPEIFQQSKQDTARDKSLRDVSEQLAAIIAESKTPGMVGAVVTSKGGTRIVAIGAAGVRSAGHPEKVTTSDQFHLGSCTKAMTATLCALMVEDGTLRFDLTLADAFPELKDSVRPEYRSVTLADLLHHRSGIPADLNSSGLWGRIWSHPGPPEKSRADLIPEILKLPPVGTPGKSYLYSNAGYAIAGHICERTAKKPYEQLLRERVWQPLAMESAGFNVPGIGDDEQHVSQPRGHNAAGKSMLPTEKPGPDNPQGAAPAGTAHMNISDWAKFCALHLAGERGDKGLLLKPASFKTLHALPDVEDAPGKDYAMGWIVTPRPWAGEGKDANVLTHSGSNTMWFAVTWICPSKDFAVLVCANAADKATQAACDKACRTLIQQQLASDHSAAPAPK